MADPLPESEQPRVRPARPADAERIAAFQVAMARETEDLELAPERVRAGVARALADPGRGRYLVAELGGEVVACLLVTREWSDWRDGWFWWIQSVYTAPAARGRGAYRRLHETDPVHRSRISGGWVFVRYDDVLALLNDRRLSSDLRNLPFWPRMKKAWISSGRTEEELNQPPMLNSDPPRHTRLRALVNRAFTATAPNQLWLSDITEHWTREGKLYMCAIKDVFSNRIVGWAIDERMKARLVVAAIEMAVARRSDVAGCILHSDRGSQFRARKVHRALAHHGMLGSMGQSAPPATTPPWNRSSACSRRTS